jgi:hypothetical protein
MCSPEREQEPRGWRPGRRGLRLRQAGGGGGGGFLYTFPGHGRPSPAGTTGAPGEPQALGSVSPGQVSLCRAMALPWLCYARLLGGRPAGGQRGRHATLCNPTVTRPFHRGSCAIWPTKGFTANHNCHNCVKLILLCVVVCHTLPEGCNI